MWCVSNHKIFLPLPFSKTSMIVYYRRATIDYHSYHLNF